MTGPTISHYRISEEIGRGAMGRVYKAQDQRSGRFVALKVAAEKYLENHEMLQRFEREGLAISSQEHPHICAVDEPAFYRHGTPAG